MASFVHKLAFLLAVSALACKGGVKASVANNEPAQNGNSGPCLPEGPYGPNCPPPALKITDVSNVIVRPGERVTFQGENFRSNLAITKQNNNGDLPIEFSAESASKLSVRIPEDQGPGLVKLNLVQDGVSLKVNLLSDGGQTEFFVTNMTPDTICSGVKYYDRNGSLQNGTRNCGTGGSASGCNVDGQVGCMSTVDYPAVKLTALDPWHLRFGVTVAGVAGKLPVNCRNGTVKSLFSAELPRAVTYSAGDFILANHNLLANAKVRLNYKSNTNPLPVGINDQDLIVDSPSTNTFKLKNSADAYVTLPNGVSDLTVSRVSLDQSNVYSTLDHDLTFANSGYIYSGPWSTGYYCGGLETSVGDSNSWRDVTVDATNAPSTCASTPANCALQDKISGLTWTKALGTQTKKDWASAMIACSKLTAYNGKSGWRLPTQLEIIAASEHGAVSVTNDDWIPTYSSLWTSTTVSQSNSADPSSQAWVVFVVQGVSMSLDKSVPSDFVCVR